MLVPLPPITLPYHAASSLVPITLPRHQSPCAIRAANHCLFSPLRTVNRNNPQLACHPATKTLVFCRDATLLQLDRYRLSRRRHLLCYSMKSTHSVHSPTFWTTANPRASSASSLQLYSAQIMVSHTLAVTNANLFEITRFNNHPCPLKLLKCHTDLSINNKRVQQNPLVKDNSHT